MSALTKRSHRTYTRPLAYSRNPLALAAQFRPDSAAAELCQRISPHPDEVFAWGHGITEWVDGW